MEAFALYLFKSVIWISGFTLIYYLFLRNERYFLLNRIYLVSGILVSIFFPLISVHYQVLLPAQVISTFNSSPFAVQSDGDNYLFDFRHLLLWSYVAGIVFFAFRLIWHLRSLRKTINKANINTQGKAKLIRSSEFSASFSFFNYIFVNPSITDLETEEIMNHELVHIQQKHWFDLVLVELLRIFQWFNPLVWIYVRFMRQNHEYLADEVALQRTSNPANYRAALLNQIVGSNVVSLSNSFNYSLNKKRFNMMKNIMSSPYRKLKILLILPVIAIILYSFAEPEYQYSIADQNNGSNSPVIGALANEVKGKVVQEDGKPLAGATVIVSGTTIGTITDLTGYFAISNIPENGSLVVSYVGFKSMVVKADFTTEMIIKMTRQLVSVEEVNIYPATPPPPMPSLPPLPPPPPLEGVQDGKTPLIVIDGVISDGDLSKINPNSIESMSVHKNFSATEKYGERGKDGVIEITTKKVVTNTTTATDVNAKGSSGNQNKAEKKFVVVEEMPMFPGGESAMREWISKNMNYPAEAVKNKIEGVINVNFVVTSTGKIENVEVRNSTMPLLDAEAIRVVKRMPDWKHGTQNGKPVDVDYMVPVEFRLQ